MAHGRPAEGMKPASPIHRGGSYLCPSVKPVVISIRCHLAPHLRRKGMKTNYCTLLSHRMGVKGLFAGVLNQREKIVIVTPNVGIAHATEGSSSEPVREDRYCHTECDVGRIASRRKVHNESAQEKSASRVRRLSSRPIPAGEIGRRLSSFPRRRRPRWRTIRGG